MQFPVSVPDDGFVDIVIQEPVSFVVLSFSSDASLNHRTSEKSLRDDY